MKKHLILTGLLLIASLTVYCQDTTINKQVYKKILISFDNCNNEVNFYKAELEKCNYSDSLKSIILTDYQLSCERKLKAKDKEIKSSKFTSFIKGSFVGAVIVVIIKLLI